MIAIFIIFHNYVLSPVSVIVCYYEHYAVLVIYIFLVLAYFIFRDYIITERNLGVWNLN